MADSQNAANALRIAKEEACKAAEDKSAEMERLKENHSSTISQLGKAHVAEISKLKEDHTSEVSKLREDYAAEISSLQKKHDSVLVDERTHGYNEAIYEAAEKIRSVKDSIYKGGYEFGLETTGLSCDHELFGKVVLCPPGAFVVSSPSESEEENEEEERAEIPPPSHPPGV